MKKGYKRSRDFTTKIQGSVINKMMVFSFGDKITFKKRQKKNSCLWVLLLLLLYLNSLIFSGPHSFIYLPSHFSNVKLSRAEESMLQTVAEMM